MPPNTHVHHTGTKAYSPTASRITRLSTYRGPMRWHFAVGRTCSCPAKQSGSGQRADPVTGCGLGVMNRLRRCAVTLGLRSPKRPLLRVFQAEPQHMGCWIWQATCGNGLAAYGGLTHTWQRMGAKAKPPPGSGSYAVAHMTAQHTRCAVVTAAQSTLPTATMMSACESCCIIQQQLNPQESDHYA